MACTLPNLTYDDVRTALVNKTGIFEKNPDITAEEISARLDALDDLISVKTIPNEDLPKEAYKSPSGKTERYVISDGTQETVVPGRFTDSVARKFEKLRGRDNAKEISENPDNVIKAESGTTVHAVLEDLTHNLANSDPMFHNTGKPSKSDLEIKNTYSISDSVLSEAKRIAQNNIDFLKKTQREIDKDGKIYLKTERLLPNMSQKEMGRGDVIAIFSDATGGYIDYKTAGAKADTVTWANGQPYVVSDEWTPTYKQADFALQLNKINKVLTNEMGVKQIRFSRIQPIFLQNAFKDKDDTSKGKLTKRILKIQGTGEFFKPIPIIAEKTGIKTLDEAITKLLNLKANYQARLDKEQFKTSDTANVLRGKINKINKAFKGIIIDKDLTYLTKGLNSILNELGSDYSKLSLERINEMVDDIRVWEDLAITAPLFYKTLNLTKEEIADRVYKADAVTGQILRLKTLLVGEQTNRALLDNEQVASARAKELTWVDKWFRHLSQIDSPIFQKFFNMLSKANDFTRKNVNKFETELKVKAKTLEDWGANNGYKGWDVYNLLINRETGNLHAKLNDVYKKEFTKAQEDKDKKKLLEFLELKDNADEIYQDKRTKFIQNNTIDITNPKDGIKLKVWEAENNPKTGNIIYGNFYGTYYKLKDEVLEKDKYLTEDYKKIKDNKPLLDYYSFWEKSMLEARELLGHEQGENTVSRNFIPWIRKETLEMLFESGIPTFDQVKDKLGEIWNVQADDVSYGEITDKSEQDLSTGKSVRTIPRLFLQPFMNDEGKIDKTMKSYDLNKSLMIFMSMAYNYNNLRQIEAQTNALQDIIYQPQFGEVENDSEGKPIKRLSGELKKKFGYASGAAELFQKHVDYHLYGIKHQDAGKHAKLINSLKQYQVIKELVFAPLLITTNYLGQQANMFFEGQKGFFYNWKQMLDTIAFHKKALIPGTEEQSKFAAITYFFEPYGEKRAHYKSKDMRVSKALKWLDEDNLFIGYRNADEHTSNLVLISMMKNYGVDSEGNVKRLSILPEGTKSLYDSIKISEDKFEIEGLTDEGYTQFRNTVMNVSRNIKGSLSPEDMNGINFSLLGSLAMSFKNWLPALAIERLDSLHYDGTSELIRQGRYRDVSTQFGGDFDKGMQVFLPKLLKRMGQFSLDVATFGLSSKVGLNLKINENRARAQFEEYMKNNPHLLTNKTEKELYKEYIEHMQGNIRATAIELSTILYLALGLMLLGNAWDDDDSYQKRMIMRQIRRALRELSFFVNPAAIASTAGRNTVPVIGLATDIQKLATSIATNIYETVTGEDNKKTKPVGYFLRNLVPGYRITTTFELYDEDEKKQY